MRRKVRFFKDFLFFFIKISAGLGTRTPGFGLLKSEEMGLKDQVLNEAFLHFFFVSID